MAGRSPRSSSTKSPACYQPPTGACNSRGFSRAETQGQPCCLFSLCKSFHRASCWWLCSDQIGSGKERHLENLQMEPHVLWCVCVCVCLKDETMLVVD